MDKKNNMDDLLGMDIEIPEIVEQKAMDAFAAIQKEVGATYDGKNAHKMGKNASDSKRRNKWLKPLVAVAACAAILVTSIGTSIYRQNATSPSVVTLDKRILENDSAHRFSIQVMAAELDEAGKTMELTEGKAIPVAMGGYSQGWSMGTGSDGNTSYSFDLSLTCVGDGIETITYSINHGNFYVVHPEGDGFVVSGTPAREGELTDVFYFDEMPGTVTEKYDSYTVNYNYQSGENICVYLQDYLPGRTDIAEHLMYEGTGLLYAKNQIEGISKMVEDKIMTVTAKFTDGTTEDYQVVFGATYMYLELGVEPERIEDSYMDTIVCMLGRDDMDDSTAVRSVVSEADWDLSKREVKLGDDVTVEKQRRVVGPNTTEEERTWVGYWNIDREVIHVTEENANLLGLRIHDSVVLDDSAWALAEATGESQEEFRYVILAISQNPDIEYRMNENRYALAESQDITSEPVVDGTLSEEECAFFSEWCSDRENYGFFLSNYTVPDAIDFEQVLYCGAGIEPSTPWTEKDYDAYLEASQSTEIYTDVTFVRKADLADFVLRKTGEPIEDMMLLPRVYSEETETYYMEHGDTNYTSYKCVGGSKEGSIYFLVLESEMYEDYKGHVTLRKVGDDYQIFSCQCRGGVVF